MALIPMLVLDCIKGENDLSITIPDCRYNKISGHKPCYCDFTPEKKAHTLELRQNKQSLQELMEQPDSILRIDAIFVIRSWLVRLSSFLCNTKFKLTVLYPGAGIWHDPHPLEFGVFLECTQIIRFSAKFFWNVQPSSSITKIPLEISQPLKPP